MKRKIIQQGRALTMTLPLDWAKDYSLKAKDEIDIERRGEVLVVKHGKEKDVEPVKLDFDTKNERQIIHAIISAYRSGAEDIEIRFKHNKIFDRQKNEVKTSALINKVVSNLIGISVIDQKPNFMKIKEITKTNYDEFDNLLRRAFLLLLSLSNHSYIAIKEKSMEKLSEIPEIYKNIKQFSDYCLRLLHKHEYKEHKKTPVMYSVVSYIEEIANAYRHISSHYAKEDVRISRKTILLYYDLNQMIRMMYQAFYTKDQRKLEEYYRLRDKIYINLYPSTKREGTINEGGILENIGFIRLLSTRLMIERMVG